MTKRTSFVSLMLGFAMACAWMPSIAVQNLTFDGVSTVLSTGTVTLDAPVGIAVDSSFNVYVADTQVNSSPPNVGRITKIAQNGASSALTISGLTLSSAPKQIAIDGSGNLYIADSGNSRIVVVNPSTGSASVLSTGSITLSLPQGVAIDAAGDVFIADTGHSQIVKVPAGGTATAYSITGLTAPNTLSSPEGMALDLSGNLYIADSGNSRVVKVTPGGAATGAGTTLTITGTTPTTPVGVAIDSFGTLYVADSGSSRIVAVSTAMAGTNFSSAYFLTNSSPAGVAVDIYGNVYVADTGNSAVDWVQTNSVGFGHNQLGSRTAKNFSLIMGQTAGPNLTNLMITSYGKTNLDFTAGGTTTCSSGTSNPPTCIIGVQYIPASPGYREGGMILTYTDVSVSPSVVRSLTVPVYAFNDAPQAALYPGIVSVLNSGGVATQTPYQVAVDGSGNVYVGNAAGNNVVEIPAAGSATVLSTGSFTLGSVNGVVVDGSGDRLIADNQNSLIYEINAANSVYRVSIAVGGAPVTLSNPTALAVDGGGYLFIADSGNNRILKVALKDPTLTTTFPLNAVVVNTGGYTFNGITGLAVDSMQNLYVADRTNSRVVKLTAAGVSSIVSFPGFTLHNPEGVALDGMGNIYVTDAGNSRILQLTTAGVVSQIQLPGLSSPTTLGGGSNNHLYGVTVDSSGNIYIADTTNNRVVKVNVSQASLSFASTKQGTTSTDSPQTATVLNLGDQALTFSANPTYPASFVANSADANPCRSSTSLAGGTACDVSVNFIPQTIGSLSQNITVSDNTLNVTNGATQLVVAKGTGLIAADATSVVVAASPSPATYGQGTTITATVSDTVTTSRTPTGSVTLVDTFGSTVTPLNNGSPVSLSNGTATLSNVSLVGIGTHTITANYAGVTGAFMASSASPVSLIVNQGTPTVTVTSSNANAGVGAAVTFTISVSSPSGAAPTGTVQLVSGSTTLGSSPLDSNGQASITTSSLPAGSDTVTAQYSGDANYLAATGSVTETTTGATFSVTGPLDVITQNVSAQTPVTLTFTPAGGFVGTVTFSCNGLPSWEVCNFSPASVTATGSDAPETVILTFANITAGRTSGPADSTTLSSAVVLLAGQNSMPAIVGAVESQQGRSRRCNRAAYGKASRAARRHSIWASAGMILAVCFLSACGSHYIAPATYSVNVVATVTQAGPGYTGPSVSSTLLKVTFTEF